MYVTIIYYYQTELYGYLWTFSPYQQFEYSTSIYKDVVIDGKLYKDMEHYKIEIGSNELYIPSYYSRLEKEKRPFEKSYNRYHYDKLIGRLDQPADWEADYTKRTGNRIKKKADFNGENIVIPKAGRPGSSDQDEHKDSGDQIFEI